MKPLSIATLVALLCCGCDRGTNSARTTVPETRSGNVTDRDNTGINERDRSPEAKTPIDQNENKKDVEITANIRKRVVATKMSVNAQNVKIITQDGRVTLRGPVKNEDEKKQIEDIARDVAGEGNVDSQLEVEQQP